MRIGILAWGSLIWDPRELPREGIWQEQGPLLPIEFSRVSQDGRLTLVIDPEHGERVPTLFILSPRADIEDAIADLRTREGTSSNNIGFVDLERNTHRSRVQQLIPDLRAWASEHNFRGLVWTDLAPNFQSRLGHIFSIDSAEQYLRRLPRGVAAQARRYIVNAPAVVDTPLRRRLNEIGWLGDLLS